MNVRLKMDKAYFTGLYKWLNLMSATVTPECKDFIVPFLEENRAIFDKINDEEFALTEKGQGKLQIGDVVRITKRNIYKDKDAEYVIVQMKEDLDKKHFGLLPLDHILNEDLISKQVTARPWRWFNVTNIRYVRSLTDKELVSFQKWKLSRTRKKDGNDVVSTTTLFDSEDTSGEGSRA